MNIEQNQIVNSALWAAYGDALGFITELASPKILKARTGVEHISQLIAWKRLIGGKFGATVDLPSGTYSDDTQLRLATSRAIKSNGHFAIHSFSKIEIPVWQNYALGAGRGSKLAASELAKNNTVWFNNFFDHKSGSYVRGGGNGAAMRIQPHVWSAMDLSDYDKYILDVVKNSITTHGHPRAIAGAVFHALSLACTLINRRLPTLAEFEICNAWTLEIPRIIGTDTNLETIWRTQFESSSGTSLKEAYSAVHDELAILIALVSEWYDSSDKNYQTLAEKLGLFDEKTRGSGTLTAVAASAAALLINDMPVENLFQEVINTLGTDTDSIATMMGAIIGVVIDDRPLGILQDEGYIVAEAQRLHAISQGDTTKSFDYPNAMTWKSPVSLVDYVSNLNNNLHMYPFGLLEEQDQPFSLNSNANPTFYQWVKSAFGQSFLIKRRDYNAIKAATEDMFKPSAQLNSPTVPLLSRSGNGTAPVVDPVQATFDPPPFVDIIDIDELSRIAIKNNFDQKLIGSHIIRLAESNWGVNGVVAYSAIISNALVSKKAKIHLT